MKLQATNKSFDQDLKDAYFSELATRKSNAPSAEETPVTQAKTQTAVTSTKTSRKPTLKRKASVDPFGSDNDGDSSMKPKEAAKPEIEAKKPKVKPKLKQKVEEDPFGSASEEDKPKKAKSTALKGKQTQQSDDDDGEDRPKKKRAVGN